MRVTAFLILLVGCGSATPGERPSATATTLTLSTTTPDESTDAAHDSSTAQPSSGEDTVAGSSSSSSSSSGSAPDLGGGGFTPLRVAVISDLNGSYGSTDYEASVHAGVAHVVALAPDLVLSTGDMVAGQQSGLDYAAMWGGFHAAVSDPLAAAGLPFAITPGNHDASGYPTFVEERELFVSQWQPRKPALDYLDDSAYPLRYSFFAGPALFVALDDTTVGPLDDEQMGWLADQLEQGDDHPTKIVFGHVPLWPFTEGRETEVIGDPALEQLLALHDVDLFVSGHHHGYFPGRRGTLRLAGTPCIGAGPRALIGTAETSAKALLTFELDASGEIVALEAYAAPDFAAPIDRASLPSAIVHDGVGIDRDDG